MKTAPAAAVTVPTAAIYHLPAAALSGAPASMRGAVPGPSPRPRHLPTRQDFAALRVLILEDDALQAQLLRAVLKALGVVVVTEASDGVGGLALLGGGVSAFDIVIADLKMAGMDGIEFMRRAVKRRIAGFILSSALEPELLASAEKVVRGYGIPLLGVLSKPIQVECLRQMLVQFIDRRSTATVPEAVRPAPPWSKRALLAALDAQQFQPFFQPKIDLVTQRLDGVEILARWAHPELGILAPLHFIALMEQEGLIDRLTETIFRQSLACARQWEEEGEALPMALNISPLTLENIGTPERILSMCNEYGIAPELITIEVTETAVAKNPRNVLETVTRLRMNGFKISVDDFGTGYSSLQQLSEIPFTELKIDRSFVSGMAHSAKSRAILETIMRLAATLKLRTVAEGIETPAELEVMRALGAVSGQGYLFAKPMSAADLYQWRAAASAQRGG